jgi:two-component system, LuxR family, sensor kinase FixL
VKLSSGNGLAAAAQSAEANPRVPPYAALRRVAGPALFIAVYLALEWASYIYQYNGLPVTAWDPGLGLALAVMILRGPHYGLALFAGIVIAEVVILNSAIDGPLVIVFAAIISAGYALLAAVLRKNFQFDPALTHLRDVLILLTAAIAGSALITLLLTAILLLDGQLLIGNTLTPSLAFLIGDVIGIAVTTPLLLRLAQHWREGTLRAFLPPLPEAAVFCVVVLAALWLIARTESTDGFKLFYLLFLPVVVAAVRRGLDGATLSLAITQLALVGLLIRHGHEVKGFTEFQILMCVLTATGLIVGIVVSERHEADRKARQAAARLKDKENEIAHAARFSLVSGMTSALAHEINQPMAAARALARSAQEILRQPQADMARAERNLATAVAEIDLASGIVRRMREFIRRGRPHVSTIDVASLLDDTLTLIRPEAARKGATIDVDVAADASPVRGDRIQLQQVVLNLVRNAIDELSAARQPDGAIRIVVRRAEHPPRVEFAVMDNGPGIAPELAEKLFQPLTTSKKEGLGLGLSISLAIVEAHGGRIWLHSGAPGATEFRFSLPLEPPTAGSLSPLAGRGLG